MRVNKGRTVELRAQLVRIILRLLYYCQPADAVLVLDEARKSYAMSFEEAVAEEAAKKPAPAPAVRTTKWDDGNFG